MPSYASLPSGNGRDRVKSYTAGMAYQIPCPTCATKVFSPICGIIDLHALAALYHLSLLSQAFTSRQLDDGARLLNVAADNTAFGLRASEIAPSGGANSRSPDEVA